MGMHPRVAQPRVVYGEYVEWVLCNWYVVIQGLLIEILWLVPLVQELYCYKQLSCVVKDNRMWPSNVHIYFLVSIECVVLHL